MKTSLKKILILILSGSFSMLAQTATAPSSGNGTAGSPYQIATWQNLYWISQNSSEWSSGKYFIQTANIDLTATDPAINTWNSGAGWSPIGTSTTPFSGNYNGQNYTINGLYINRASTDNIGLFGYTNGASISSVGLTSGSVSGKTNVGTLVGANYGSTPITNSNNTGTVRGSSQVGGLVGNNYNGTITLSYNTGTIGNGIITTSGSSYVGGLVGHNDRGIIRNCYSTGSIDGGYWGVGGLVGYNNTNGGTVDKCYSTGHINAYPNPDPSYGIYRFGGLVGDCCSGPVSNSFWDVETSGTSLSPSGQGTGKTTAQMKTQSTFTNVGWDFTTIWEMVGTNYPRLISNQDSALPVELSYFTGIASQVGVELVWHTNTEINNYGFVIERSINGKGWINIGFVNGNGNSNSPKNYSFVDSEPTSGKIKYRLKQIDLDGKFEISHALEINIEVPVSFALNQNYPNPFNPATTISYQLPLDSKVSLTVYDALGIQVTKLVDEVKRAGSYKTTFDGSLLASGIYFYQLKADNYIATKKFVLIK